MKYLKLALLPIIFVLLAACASQPVNVDYTAFKQSKPRSILVLPPTNSSPDVGAGPSLLSVVSFPLAEAGYYVIPVTLMSETFKQNGITQADEAQNVSPAKLREIFGADAGLYINITKYGTSYRLLTSVVEVEAGAKLVDLRTGVELWQGNALVVWDKNSNNNSGLAGLLVSAIVNQIASNVADDSHKVAIQASAKLLSAGRPGSILFGPYNPRYGTD